MNRASPNIREFAKLLVAFESKQSSLHKYESQGSFEVCNKLGSHLAIFMGVSGLRALLLRAVALSIVEVPWLSQVKISSDGSLASLDRLDSENISRDASEASVVLIAQLLGLLVAFIGERMTLQMVLEVWPKLSVNDLILGIGETK